MWKILLLEDNLDDASILVDSFRNTGFKGEFLVSQHMQEAKEVIKAETSGEIKLFITDLNLVGQEGLEMVQFIRKEHTYKYAPIIVLSGSLLSFDVIQSYRHGATLFFEKINFFDNLMAKTACLLNVLINWPTFPERP